jgi:hypothetical protein
VTAREALRRAGAASLGRDEHGEVRCRRDEKGNLMLYDSNNSGELTAVIMLTPEMASKLRSLLSSTPVEEARERHCCCEDPAYCTVAVTVP